MSQVNERPSPGDDSERAYWSEKLAGRPPALELPMTRSRPPQPTSKRTRLAFKLPNELTRDLRAFLDASDVPLFDGMLAAFGALLYRTTRQGDLLLGLREEGRHAALRFALEGSQSFRVLLGNARRELRDCRAHALELPALLKAAHSTRPDNLFQVLVTSDKLGAADAKGYDLLLALTKGAAGSLYYDAELLDPRVVERMLGHLETLLRGALANPDAPLGQLPLLTEAERHTILVEWNATAIEFPRDFCLHQLFEQRVQRCPDAPALAFEEKHLTYAALDAKANRLAQHLRSLGVGPNVLVGICVERSFEMVIGLLAIAKAGGAYLPMDPAYPRERLAFMLEDSCAGVLLTQGHLRALLPEPKTDVQLVLLDEAKSYAANAAQPDSGVGPEDMAYVIYTSGSTGKPKGVVLDHRGRVNNFLDFNRRFAVGTGDALIALASLSFDMCAYDVFGTLAAGATIVLPRPDEMQDARAWARLMQQRRVTIWHTAPAMLKMLVEHCESDPNLVPSALRLALLGGDWIPVSLPDRLRALVPEARVISMGGATECSMDSTIYEVEEVDPSWRSIPYGVPMANQLAYVLDEDRQPVPALVPGELYLGGIGVGKGYYKRPELSAERFLPDPFAETPGARMYRTGDLARWMEDGNLELLGRVDNQVKIRGYRIELGEIEARLRTHGAVREGVVVAKLDASGERRLVAYYVPRASTELSEPRFAHLLAADLRRTLAADLPHYMVPSLYVRLEALPLSPNGKVDRKRLPEPSHGRAEHLAEYVAPRDVLEETLAAIWAEVLDVEQVGVEDAFLDLGGHSILAAQVQARLAEVFPFEVSLRDLFETSTVAKLATHLRNLARGAGVDLDEICTTLRTLASLSDDEVRARLASNS
ncbi:MAG: amino acid adenylation domain-containing protein [Planctomycetes bacterium]|nr:amino acid adenylation domain-containing protein [Planctomycetota bacterium]